MTRQTLHRRHLLPAALSAPYVATSTGSSVLVLAYDTATGAIAAWSPEGKVPWASPGPIVDVADARWSDDVLTVVGFDRDDHAVVVHASSEGVSEPTRLPVAGDLLRRPTLVVGGVVWEEYRDSGTALVAVPLGDPESSRPATTEPRHVRPFERDAPDADVTPLLDGILSTRVRPDRSGFDIERMKLDLEVRDETSIDVPCEQARVAAAGTTIVACTRSAAGGVALHVIEAGSTSPMSIDLPTARRATVSAPRIRTDRKRAYVLYIETTIGDATMSDTNEPRPPPREIRERLTVVDLAGRVVEQTHELDPPSHGSGQVVVLPAGFVVVHGSGQLALSGPEPV